MSVDQIRAALEPLRPYFIYRVVNVDTSKPTVYIYDFKALSQSQQIKFSASNVSVMLPKPEKPRQ